MSFRVSGCFFVGENLPYQIVVDSSNKHIFINHPSSFCWEVDLLYKGLSFGVGFGGTIEEFCNVFGWSRGLSGSFGCIWLSFVVWQCVKKTVDSVEHQDIVQPQVLYTLYSCVFPISKLSSTTGYFKATYQFTLASKQHPLRRKFFIYVALTGVFIFICWSALLQSFKRYEKVSYLPKTHNKQFILPPSFQNRNHPQIPTNKKNLHPTFKPPKPTTTFIQEKNASFVFRQKKTSQTTTSFIPSSWPNLT